MAACAACSAPGHTAASATRGAATAPATGTISEA